MKGLEGTFAKEFEKEAQKRGFTELEKSRRGFGATPIYKTADWLIVAAIVTGFPETTVTITFTPQHPNPERPNQELIKAKATWIPEHEKWSMLGTEYTSSELICHAFNQLDKSAV